MTFAEALRKLRGDKTQKDYAAFIGFSPQYLSDLEKGRRKASPWFVDRLTAVDPSISKTTKKTLNRLGAFEAGWDV